MCLAVPAQIIAITQDQANATVELSGVLVEVSLALVEDVLVGDYVLIHVGFALQKIDPEEAEATLALFAEVALAAQE